jgi:hypothetical protein
VKTLALALVIAAVLGSGISAGLVGCGSAKPDGVKQAAVTVDGARGKAVDLERDPRTGAH